MPKKEMEMNKGLDPITVLVVDHEEGVRQGSKRIIDRMGCHTLAVDRGETALGVLEKEDVDIVLLDLELPGMSGMKALRIIGETYPHIVMIVITGFAAVDTAVAAMKNGAYDVLPKPFEPDQLRMAVNRAREKVALDKATRRGQLEKERSLADLETEKSLVHTIVNALPTGLLVTNPQGRVVLANAAFFQLMGLSSTTEPGQSLEHYIHEEGLVDLLLEISRGHRLDFGDIPDYEFSPGSDRFLMALARPVMGDQQRCLGAVLTLEDITAMKVVDRLKSEFVAKVSHELRSPLSTIHEQLAVVLSDMRGQVPSFDEHLLSRAKEKTQGLISLIGDLLDLSRIESGAVCETPKPVALEELLANIIDFLGSRAAAKQQSLTLFQPKEPLPAVNADPLALESIFGNLIANAINYTPENGTIEVRISLAGINLEVQVSDDGLGMESRHLERIFERFYRIKTEKTRYITGTGLGLPIVKGLIDALGGTIRVDSALDKGSTFTVLLPAEAAPDAMPAGAAKDVPALRKDE
jgi:two-component system phosphate regulon sensor histidine kinase PhoR